MGREFEAEKKKTIVTAALFKHEIKINRNIRSAKLKIEKRGDEILIVHCCFSVSQNELKF
jgi:hypothetical protein